MGDPQDMENIYPKLEYITKLGKKWTLMYTQENRDIYEIRHICPLYLEAY